MTGLREMTIQLRTDGRQHLYEQIYDYIKEEIRTGKLLAGERLPSTRFLAEYLQVARSTVDYAYGQLLSEGYIEARPCRGYFVCSVEELVQLDGSGGFFARGKEAGGFRDGSGESFPEGHVEECRNPGRVREGNGEKCRNPGRAREENGEEVRNPGRAREGNGEEGQNHGNAMEDRGFRADFSPYDIDMSGFPFSVWKKITKNILSYANSDLFAKGEAQGDWELRRTISRYLHSSRGVDCRPEQIIVGAGNDYLLMLLEKILGRHVHIAMENPTYKRSYRIFRSFAYHITTVEMDEAGMRADRLEQSQVTAAYVMPSHQFPTGTVMPIGRRMELLKWADSRPDRYLIEDDYDSEFRFRGKPIPALQASDGHGKVIYIGTFSKAIAPAIRVSFMVLPEVLLERYRENCSFYSCTVSRIDQSILNEFIRDGYFERHLNKMRKIYRAKHDMLLACLQQLRGGFVVSGENAGLHLLLTARGKVTEEELVARALEKKVRVYGLSESMVEDAAGSATVLVGFGGLTEEKIREGAALLREAWGEFC